MDDGFSMEVLETSHNSIHERLDFRGSKVLPRPDDLIQGFILAKLKEYVDMIFVLKIVDELNDIFVMQCFVKSNLVEELS
jgi:hypothetical protein